MSAPRLSAVQQQVLLQLQRDPEGAFVSSGVQSWPLPSGMAVGWPTARALRRLGLVKLHDGEVLLTDAGREWAP